MQHLAKKESHAFSRSLNKVSMSSSRSTIAKGVSACLCGGRAAVTAQARGAYLLVINLERDQSLAIGALGEYTLKRGIYLYIGSARGGIGGRVRRHLRLAKMKQGGGYWHIDNILRSSVAEVVEAIALPGADECAVSRALAADGLLEVPVAGFGSSDCRNGCPAHLYRLDTASAIDKQKITKRLRTIFQ